jgi:hypothetical protein
MFSGSTPAFPAQWFTTYFVLSPARPGLFVTVALKKRELLANLTPAKGRQDHTILPSASRAVRQKRIRVHRIPPRVRDDREPPLMWDETAGNTQVICVGCEEEYFCKWGWTGFG